MRTYHRDKEDRKIMRALIGVRRSKPQLCATEVIRRTAEIGHWRVGRVQAALYRCGGRPVMEFWT